MQGSVSILSPAKVNLHLDVQARRNDGYHSITSLFHLIDLYDEITMRSLKEKKICRILGMPQIPEENNLIWKAVELFREKTGVDSGIEVAVIKNIPEQSGLGGGSSNAASTLRLLNSFYNTGLSQRELAGLGEGLGSDVPFFCLAGCAVVTGRGENVRTVPPRSDLWGIVVFPRAKINTKSAYDLFDRQGTIENGLKPHEIEQLFIYRRPHEWDFFNSFTPLIRQNVGEIRDVLERLEHIGADFTEMSGSGSACFALFSDIESRDAAHKECSGQFACRKIHLLDKFPDPVLQ